MSGVMRRFVGRTAMGAGGCRTCASHSRIGCHSTMSGLTTAEQIEQSEALFGTTHVGRRFAQRRDVTGADGPRPTAAAPMTLASGLHPHAMVARCSARRPRAQHAQFREQSDADSRSKSELQTGIRMASAYITTRANSRPVSPPGVSTTTRSVPIGGHEGPRIDGAADDRRPLARRLRVAFPQPGAHRLLAVDIGDTTVAPLLAPYAAR